jgi:polysaccharide pyruvyl transferase WcaK-like protein
MDREADLPFLKSLRSECDSRDRVHLVKGAYRPREILGLIGHLKLLIGGRFHSVLFGVMSNVPTIGISSHHKIRDFLVDVGLGSFSHPLGDGMLMENVDLDMSKLGSCVRGHLESSANVRRRMEEGAKELEMRARRSIEILRGLISGD